MVKELSFFKENLDENLKKAENQNYKMFFLK